MKIDMKGSIPPITGELETHISRRIDLALRRFADRVDCVVVRVVELSSYGAARERRCRLSARLAAPAPAVTVEATDTDAFVAVSQAAERLEAAVIRSLSVLGREDDPREPA